MFCYRCRLKILIVNFTIDLCIYVIKYNSLKAKIAVILGSVRSDRLRIRGGKMDRKKIIKQKSHHIFYRSFRIKIALVGSKVKGNVSSIRNDPGFTKSN